ncbi:MAG: biotin synthase [Hydrogenophaga sp.]|jgi:malonyl-CoA O-methyltransferase|nr:biotin synthase [Hydrogenophaga sp.]
MVTPPSDLETAVPGLDGRASARWQHMARTHSPWLHEEVAARMADRLQWFREKPASWLHWEPVLGGLKAHQQLRTALPDARSYVAAEDGPQALRATAGPAVRSWNPAHWLRARGPDLAGPDTRVGMVWSNMGLHLEPRPQTLLRRWHGYLATDGFLMFSCLGPDTLMELRRVYEALDWPSPTHVFTDMHDWGDMLVQAGFAAPVMDMERLVLSYSGAAPLLDDLRELGRNLNASRHPAWRGRGWRERLGGALEAHLPRSDDGRLLLTVEIIYGHAFKPQPRVPLASTSAVSVDEMRTMLRAKKPAP